ncbi:MAG: hypothetical protein DWQ01_14950 [Planctomycetota bacterium]|nr:MAG: hypothetical protein DWQ01_14950 [Planctomycetota bacterium]
MDHTVSGGLVEPTMSYLTPGKLYAAGPNAMQVWIGMPAVESVLATVGGTRFIGPGGIGATFGPDGSLAYFGRH